MFSAIVRKPGAKVALMSVGRLEGILLIPNDGKKLGKSEYSNDGMELGNALSVTAELYVGIVETEGGKEGGGTCGVSFRFFDELVGCV